MFQFDKDCAVAKKISLKILMTTIYTLLCISLIGILMSKSDFARADSVTILDADTTEVSDGCIYLGVYGTYYTDAQAALERINEIRYEACVEGVPNPNNTSVPLTVDDYVPIQWSSTLEKIARIRAAEAAFTIYHERLNGSSIFTVSYDGMKSNCEDLAWDYTSTNTMVYGINLWYSEKSDWLGVCDGSISASSVQTGHYTSIINPKYRYIGIGDFYTNDTYYPNTTAAAMSRTTDELDTTMLPGEENVIQKLEVDESNVKEYYIDGSSTVGVGNTTSLQAMAKISYTNKLSLTYTGTMYCVDDITYTSSDTSVLTVDSDGTVTGISYGTATVTAYMSGKELATFEMNVICKDGCDLGDYDSDYQVSGTCAICGYSATYTVPSKMLVYWKNSTSEDSYYYSSIPSSNPEGSSLICYLKYINGDSGYSDILVECSNPELLQVPEKLTNTSVYSFKVLGAGTVTLTLTPKYNPSLKKTYTVKLTHQFGEWITYKEPTCSELGESRRYCSECNEYESKTIDTTEHTPVIDEAVAATCTVTGLTEGSHCSVCGAVITVQTSTATIDHTPVIDEAVAATCTVTGLTEGSHCSVCGAVITVQTSTATIDHTAVTDQAVRATCSATGLTEGSHCSVCGKVIVKQEVTTATLGTGHSYYMSTIAPTCSEQGYDIYVCAYCGDYFINNYKATIAHTPVTDNEVAATCDSTGLTEGSHCSVCNAVLTVQNEIAKTAHDYEYVSHAWNDDYSTCTVLLQCKNYESHLSEYKLTITQDYEEGSKCDEPGIVTFIASGNIDGLDLKFTETKELGAIGHYYQAVVTAPTCTEKGYTTYTCERCGDSYVDNYVNIIDHTPVVLEAVASTCSATGLTEGSYCLVCGAVLMKQETTEMIAHTPETLKAVASTCSSTGLTEGSICTVCGETIIPQQTVEKLPHTVVIDYAYEPTCTSTGRTEGSHCHICQTVIKATNTIAKIEHTVVIDKAVTPTCTKSGNIEGSHCAVCNYTFVYPTEIPAYGHSYSLTKTVSATYVSTGYKLYKCSRCDATKKTTIAKLTLATPAVSLSNTSGGVKISWNKITGAKGYYVYRKASGDKSWTRISTITSAATVTYTDTKASAGKVYYYTVKAYGKTGSTTYYSNYLTNKLIKRLTQPTVTLNNVSTGVKISWKKITGASGYYVYRRTVSGKWILISTITSASTVAYTDTNAVAGTTYYYTVKAYGKSGSSTYYSSYVIDKTIKHLKQPTVTLSKVLKGVKIAWSKITGASGYYVYRKTATGSWSRIKTITSASTLNYTDTTVKSGTTYYYTVKAYSGSFYSAYVTNKSIKYKK
jgi:fibronectin type 3 domain-containing protein